MRISDHSPITTTLEKFVIMLLEGLQSVSNLNTLGMHCIVDCFFANVQFLFDFSFVTSFTVDLFSGAGGMSLGLEKYFNVKWVVDNNEIACSTLNSNKRI
jgi:hypothetical protein